MEKIYSVEEVVDSLATLSGEVVAVRGVLRIGRENHSIEGVRENETPKRQSRLWVFFHHATLGTKEKDLARMNGAQVIATGIPDISRKGHLRGFPGSFTIRHLRKGPGLNIDEDGGTPA